MSSWNASLSSLTGQLPLLLLTVMTITDIYNSHKFGLSLMDHGNKCSECPFASQLSRQNYHMVRAREANSGLNFQHT